MRSLEVIGAGGGNVTGSQYILEANDGQELMIDCGGVQGPNELANIRHNRRRPDFANKSGIVVSHAHLDHIGLIPHASDSDVPIYMPPAALEISDIILENADGLSNNLIYKPGSRMKALARVTTIDYDTPFEIGGLTVTFRDAGHVLGSASIEVEEKRGEKIVFSGDLGNTPSRVVRPTTFIDEADIVVMETTYGNRTHSTDDPLDVLADAINWSIKHDSALLIPAFSYDRTQLVINMCKELVETGRVRKLRAFLDSPMASKVTDVYKSHPELLNEKLRGQAEPFNFRGLFDTSDPRQRNRKVPRTGSTIIIAGAGMMSGGRILKHAANHIGGAKNMILFTGYAGEGTLSRKIIEGEKQIYIANSPLSVRAKVQVMPGVSAHADQNGLLDWLRHIQGGERRTRKVILTHGDNSARIAFKEKVNEELGIYDVVTPDNNVEVDLRLNEQEAA